MKEKKLTIRAREALKLLNRIESRMYTSDVVFESMDLIHKRNELTESLSVIRGELYENIINVEKINAWMEQKKAWEIEFNKIQKQTWIGGEQNENLF